MPIQIDAYSDGQLSEYSYTSGSCDTLDEILKRFTLDYDPEYVLKIRDTRGSFIIGADLRYHMYQRRGGVALVAKPLNRDQWWRRFKIENNGNVSIRSRKLKWWLFALDLEGEINPIKRSRDVSFRLATTWDVSGGRYENKKKLRIVDGLEGRMYWSVDYNLPEVTGRLSTKDRDSSNNMQAEIGYAHAEISRVEMALWPRNLSVRKETRKLIQGASGNSKSGKTVAAGEAQVEPSSRQGEKNLLQKFMSHVTNFKNVDQQ